MNHTNVDDLQVESWVAVTGRRDGGSMRALGIRTTGKPLRIVAVSLPFVCVEDATGLRDSIDIRDWRLSKLSHDYVEAFHRKPAPSSAGLTFDDCHYCGGEMVERLGAASSTAKSQWRKACRECGRYP